MGVYKRRGSNKWYGRWWDPFKKKLERKVIGDTKEEAEATLAQIKRKIRLAQLGISLPEFEKTIDELPKCLVEDVFNKYKSEKEITVRPGSWINYITYLNFWERIHKENNSFFIPLEKEKIKSFLGELQKSRSNKTVNGYLRAIKYLYKYAFLQNLIREKDLLNTLGFYRIAPSRPMRFLEKEEFKSLLPFCKDFYKDLFTFLVATGLRRNEARFLEFTPNIDFNREVIYLCNKDNFTLKTKESERIIPFNLMGNAVKEILKKRRKLAAGNIVFGSSKTHDFYDRNAWNKAIKEAAKKAGLENVTLHTLRHTFGTWLVMKDISIRKIQRLMGHSDIRTTEKYTHVSEKHLKDIRLNLLND